MKDAVEAICESPVRVLRGRDVREAQVYQSANGNYVYWSPFTGERVTIDRNRLLRHRWPKPPAGMPQATAYTPGKPAPDQIEQQRLKRGVTADANHKLRKVAYREVIENRTRERKWSSLPPPPCPVGAAGLVPEGPATHIHHLRGRAGTLLLDTRFFLAVSYPGIGTESVF